MPGRRRFLLGFAALVGAMTCLIQPRVTDAYIEAPHSFGQVVNLSTNILTMRVEKVDREKNLIIYRKVEDIKGKHPTDIIKHNIAKAGFHPREWQYSMEVEPGQLAVFMYQGGASETFTGKYWYQAYQQGEWYGMSHGEPFLFRSFAGRPEKLAQACKDVMAGKEILVPCMVNGNLDDLHLRKAKIQRLKASLKLLDYNEKRDFAGYGGEDFRRLNGMPGFTHYSALNRVDPEAQGISAVDFDGDGKQDICLVGASRVAILQNAGDAFNEATVPGASGSRAAVWADYNGDGKPDLLLATGEGPKLYTNMGGGAFRDDTHLLPKEPGYNLTSAAWIDYDGDGRPDLLLGNGYHGLRLYRNTGPVANVKQALNLGKWYYNGPYANAFDTAFPPEMGPVDLNKKFSGKNNEEAIWKEGNFTDGQINSLALFKPENNTDASVYLYREIECAKAMDLPVSLGSDDTLTVWLNGKKIHAENVSRGAAPDQAQPVLKLEAGVNKLLLKICQGGGEWAFYFQAKANIPQVANWGFEDVSTKAGFGLDGIGGDVKGDTLTVCDVNGDGRPDFLYGAGNGLLVLNTPAGFVVSKDSGINCKFGKVGPVFGDFDNDGFPDLFVPQLEGQSRLYKNDGKGRFTDVTAKSGDLGKFAGMATSAAWGDVDNDGQLDLVVGCLRGPNLFFRNKGDGTFEDATESLGLGQKIFNSQGVCLVDLNNDGRLDMIFNNEGQESCVLLGNPAIPRKATPVTMQVAGAAGVVGSQVRVLDKDRKAIRTQQISGGDGRGGQAAPVARFALPPGNYVMEVRFSSGLVKTKPIVVGADPIRGVLDDQEAKPQ